MTPTLAFLHTSPVHIATFDALMAELAPSIPVSHTVSEPLLQEARACGEITAHIRTQTLNLLQTIINENKTAIVVCTCSTLGGVAENLASEVGVPVLRIDRPMAEAAIAQGSKIILAATLTSTLEPTRDLLLAVAQQMRKNVEISDLICADAWSYFEAGDQAGYLQEVAHQLQEAAPHGDAIVLAQASMARAIELCSDITIPVLSSPRSGALAAIARYQEAIQHFLN